MVNRGDLRQNFLVGRGKYQQAPGRVVDFEILVVMRFPNRHAYKKWLHKSAKSFTTLDGKVSRPGFNDLIRFVEVNVSRQSVWGAGSDLLGFRKEELRGTQLETLLGPCLRVEQRDRTVLLAVTVSDGIPIPHHPFCRSVSDLEGETEMYWAFQ